ncbi:hypothetical protein SASPL_101680 [Salvia splendens]|uniref:LTI65/LTI78 PGEED repeat domain-containing protein n=1 Tax=Salvia splendens TaxID=180675 RepID=A0A8X8YPR2_SALSN|nr:uncharacterized protein LOC121745010 isoform X2 [Salvia splendens]KAG6436778.1 hypothetical protein SASPL_101680 [Salvia splendens]
MAQLERIKKFSESSPKSQTLPTFEQLLRDEEAYWSKLSPRGRSCHDHEVCPTYCTSGDTKKSVLSLVKDTAKKWRRSISGRRKNGFEFHDYNHNRDSNHNYNQSQSLYQNHGQSHHHDHDHNHMTPTRGSTMEDDLDHEQAYDPEFLGAPMYESEAAPDCLKETARQHPRADPVISESHKAPNMKHKASLLGVDKPVSPNTNIVTIKIHAAADKLAPTCAAMSNATHNSTNMITNTSHAVADKLAPACNVVSDATHKIATKIAGIAGVSPETQPCPEAKAELMSEDAGNLKARLNVTDDAGNMKQCATGSPQTYERGVSVKEFILNKLEPGEDEKALSQAITEGISPRKSTGETGVVDKVKEAVSSLLRQEETSNSTETSAGLISDASASSEVKTVAEPSRLASIHADKSASPSAAAVDTSNTPTVVQLKPAASTYAEKPASLSPAAPDTSIVPSNAQLNRMPSVHVRSTKVFTNSTNNSPIFPVSTNTHEDYEEETNGKILQAN